MDFLVTMQAPKETPPDMQCKDKFLIQSVVAPDGTTSKDISAELVGMSCCCFHLLCKFSSIMFLHFCLCFASMNRVV